MDSFARNLGSVLSDTRPSDPKLSLTARLLDQLDIGFCLYDEQDNVVIWNETYLAFFPEQREHIRVGVNYAETLVHFFRSNLPTAELSQIDRHVAAGVARHQAQEEPFVFQRNTGRWLKAASLPMPGGGRLRLWRDVTAEHDRESSETATPRAVAALDVAYAVFDRDGCFVTANKRYQEFFPDIGDLLQSGIAYRRHLACIGRVLGSRSASTLERLAARSTPASEPMSLRVLLERRHGGWLQLEERFGDDGTLVSIWTDATREAEAEAKILRLETYLADAVDAIPQGLLLFDGQDRLVLRNRRLETIDAALAARMTEGASLADFSEWRCRFGGADCAEAQLTRVRGRCSGEDFELADGRWLRIQSERTAHGDLLILLTDVSHEKQAATELQRQREVVHQAEKLTALGSLLAGVAHELNNPLAIVVGRAALLQSSAADPKVASQAQSIAAAAERCAKIVKTFLALARQRPPERRAVDVNAVVRDAVQLLAYGLRSTGVAVELDLAEPLPELWADPDQLSQAVINLIVNAQHALSERPEPRRLVIATRLHGRDAIAIRVSDNGPGIPPAIRNRIFEPFFTTKPVGSGTGLGLSVSLGSVQAHSGRLDYEDTPGGGATFIVTLPAIRAPEQAQNASPELPEAQRKRILVVDDEAELAELLRDILSADGHRVMVAKSGREALERLGGERFDLVVSDLMMPELDGIGLYQRLRESEAERTTPVVFLTGDSLRSATSQAVAETGCRVVEKPFEPQEIRRVVREALGTETDR